jgi:hypothetical protein
VTKPNEEGRREERHSINGRRSFVTHYSGLMNNNEKRKMVHAMVHSEPG